MNILLGAKINEGAEVIVYEHQTDPRLVVKIPQNRPDIGRVLIERIAGEQCLHQACLNAHILETDILIPGIADGVEYLFIEIQPRIRTTLFDEVVMFLGQGQINLALETIMRFFTFERYVLWASGVVMQDAGSFLKNITDDKGILKILDFSSFTCDSVALKGMILRGKAERRIRHTLEKLQNFVDLEEFGAVWDEFSAKLWEAAKCHYHL